MTEQQRKRNSDDKQSRNVKSGTNANQNTPARQTDATDDYTMPETNDAGDAISEDSLYDASGAATGGGVDTPTAVEESTEAAVRKHKPINQGSSAYSGGGADNGSDL
ncbi:MAG: hypothetical protein M3Z24_02800 [Chloroflexota bacterium]|nr:hypothetical protein [Chloroflexota bacterium]